MKIITSQKGYSLLELVVYLAIFSFICLVLIKSLITSMTTYTQAQSYRRLQNNGELVMERITREIRQATFITSGSSVFDTNNGTLSLSGKDLSNIPQNISFSIVNNAVVVTVNGVTSTLTSTQVKPSSLVFRNVSAGDSSAIKVELILKTTVGYIISANFYNTIMLKGK